MKQTEIKRRLQEIVVMIKKLQLERQRLQKKCAHPGWNKLINRETGDILADVCRDCHICR